MSQILFQFNKQFFEQTTETAMGNLVSPFLADVSWATKIQQTLNNFSKTWLKYIDDIFEIIAKNFNVDDFLENLNCKYSRSLYNKF